MDEESRQVLVHLLKDLRVASLGTLREGYPSVSMVLFATAPDFSEIYIHISRLARHTQDVRKDERVSLMIAEQDDGGANPGNLARLSIRGEVTILPPEETDFESVKTNYLEKLPFSASCFELADFSLYRIKPLSARFFVRFGRIFNLLADDIKEAAA